MLSVMLFTSSTCKFCGPVKELLDDLSKEYDLDVFTVVVDESDENMQKAREWGITGVPTGVAIGDQESPKDSLKRGVKGRFVGSVTRSQLVEWIERHIQPDVLQESSGGSDSGSDPVLRCPS